jgi:hypothetical protein
MRQTARQAGTITIIFTALACFLGAIGAEACGSNAVQQRQTTITTALISVNAAESAFLAWDGQHQLDLVKSALNKDDADEKLKAYRAQRAKFNLVMKAAYAALGVAAQVNDDHSVAGMVQAAAIVAQELAALGITP